MSSARSMAQSETRKTGALLSVRVTADYLGMTQSAVRHQIERGRIPALRLGTRIYVIRQTLDRHLEKLEREWMRARGAGA